MALARLPTAIPEPQEPWQPHVVHSAGLQLSQGPSQQPMADPELHLPPAACYTGRLAVYVPFGPQAAPPPPHGLPPLKTSSPGVWLRSEAGGVLTLQWRPAAPPLLTITLRNSQQLVHAPLSPGGFAFRLLCPQHGAPPPQLGGSSGHVLFLSLPAAESQGGAGQRGAAGAVLQCSYTLAVHFDTAQAGRECGALLQAIQQGSLGMVAPPAAVAAPGAAPAAAAARVTAEQAQQAGTAAAPPAPAGWDSLFGFADEASLAAAIEVRFNWALGVGAEGRRRLLPECASLLLPTHPLLPAPCCRQRRPTHNFWPWRMRGRWRWSVSRRCWRRESGRRRGRPAAPRAAALRAWREPAWHVATADDDCLS